MKKRELELKSISNEFARWQVQIENLSSLNLYDANIFSENSITEILNAIFDYKLINSNSEISNHPAIDLQDKYNRIAVQVTSTKSKAKIQYTLDKFFEENLDLKYDELLIIILGKKQKSYSNINIKNEFNFDPNKHILDFRDILKLIIYLPTNRIEKIARLLNQENLPKQGKTSNSNANKIKRILALKKRMKKDFIRKIPKEEYEIAWYWPIHKFEYHEVLIRSVDDKSWPNREENENTKIDSWFKTELWDFYDNGIELVSAITHKIIVDNEGNWDILDWKGDSRESNPNYQILVLHPFNRIPFEYIVDYDLELDSYNGAPSIFVEYAKDGMPYEETVFGDLGKYDKNDRMNCRFRRIMDNNKRMTLE